MVPEVFQVEANRPIMMNEYIIHTEKYGRQWMGSYKSTWLLVDGARCPACGSETGSVSHYLLICPSYPHER